MRKRTSSVPGFTLIEMLVVIGIVVVLAALLLPIIFRASRSGNRTRQAADLAAIAVALDAYKADFGDYPRAPVTSTGFAMLGKALFGPFGTVSAAGDPPAYSGSVEYKPGDCVKDSGATYVALVNNVGVATSTTTTWALFPCNDGFDGPGFKVGPLRVDTDNDGIADSYGGKTHGPYLEVGRFKLRGCAILDLQGNPIMYFPARPGQMNLSQSGARYISSTGLVSGMTATDRTMYNFDDNGTLATSMSQSKNAARALAGMQAVMGLVGTSICDGSTSNGQLPTSQTPPAGTPPYLLWSCGPDGFFAPFEDVVPIRTDANRLKNAVRDCDDVTNFSHGP